MHLNSFFFCNRVEQTKLPQLTIVMVLKVTHITKMLAIDLLKKHQIIINGIAKISRTLK